MGLPIYMDNHATTRTDPRVVERMLPYFSEHYGNAASRDHSYGRRAEAAVEAARGRVAASIGAQAPEIVFTSGATEANNLALFGVAEAYGEEGEHFITQATEHPSVLAIFRRLEERGRRVTILPVDGAGLVDPDAIRRALTERTVLVSVMAVNHEIGSRQPIEEIGALCKEAGVLLHCDATQALSTQGVDVGAWGVDLVSCSGHKIYGPKGVGALYVRRKGPRVALLPRILGGGHERGRRSGTLNVPGIVGLAEACALLDPAAEGARLDGLTERLWELLRAGLPGVRRNGSRDRRHPGNLHITLDGTESAAILTRLGDVAISSGAACATASRKPSHVLQAVGLSAEEAKSSLRIGLGRFNTADEVDIAARKIIDAAQQS